MKISLFDKFINGGVTPLEFDCKEDASYLFETWIESKDFDKTVFVAFLNWTFEIVDNFRDEQSSFLVTHSQDDLAIFLHDILNLGNWQDMHLIVLEFPNYKEAFGYCIDLKEGY
jgi:hypothetical protein